ncbi:MAG: BamA/TamA family outer membrane protein [Candidatus Margulisiibacteriota bacterium]
MRKILVISLTVLLSFSTCAWADQSSVGGMPYVIYNSTYGLEYGLIGRAKNFLGRHESLTLASTLIENGGNVNNFTLSFPDQDFRHGKVYLLAVDLEGSLGTYISERYYGLGRNTPETNYTTFNNQHSRVSLSLSRAYQHNFVLNTALLIASNSFTNIKQGTNPLTQELQDNCRQYYAGSIGLTLDNRDKSMDPHAGNYVLTDFDFGIAAGGSPAKYSKLTVDLRRYDTPLNKDQVLASRVMLAQMTGDVIPVYEYASLGGRDTLRGYSVNRFRDRCSALLNLEYRFPIYWVFSGAVFYETGKVTPLFTDIGLNDWASDLGAGLRINFGNVIVRGDFGRSSEGTNAYFFYDQAF